MGYFLNDFVDKKGQMIKMSNVRHSSFVIKDITSLFTTAPTMLKRNTTLSKHHFKQTTNTNQTTNTGDGLDTNANANTHDTDDETAH